MPCRSHRAMTLIELLVVIVLVGLLMALLMPVGGAAWRAAYRTQCAAQLRSIGQAFDTCAVDARSGWATSITVGGWPRMLLPYLEDHEETFICPEGGGAAAESVDIGGLVEFRVIGGGGIFFTPLEEGRWMVKLSQTQYDEARSMGLLGNAASANNLREKYDCTYKPDNRPDIFWLCMEDHGGDEDYKDVMTRVVDNLDGTVTLEMRAGATGHRNTLMDKVQGTEIMDIPSNSEGHVHTLKGRFASSLRTSYGMNARAPDLRDPSGKILALDYQTSVASPSDDWTDPAWDEDADGIPDFQRHPGRMVNVLMIDGSVRAMEAPPLDPAVPSAAAEWWEP